ncbi:U-scoloptoxin(16)-Ssd1a-like [Cochliomyia hominivorax]
MNLVLFKLSLILLFVTEIWSATSVGEFKDPDHPGKCVIYDQILSPGETIQTPGECEQVLCHEKSHVSFLGCGAIGVPPGYKLGDRVAPDADYPACCDRHFLKDD